MRITNLFLGDISYWWYSEIYSEYITIILFQRKKNENWIKIYCRKNQCNSSKLAITNKNSEIHKKILTSSPTHTPPPPLYKQCLLHPCVFYTFMYLNICLRDNYLFVDRQILYILSQCINLKSIIYDMIMPHPNLIYFLKNRSS